MKTKAQKLVMVIFLIFIAVYQVMYIEFCRSQSSPFFSVEINTSPESGLDIVFVSEGYNLEEMDLFRLTVQTYYLQLLSIKPFSQYRDHINVWRIESTLDLEAERPDSTSDLLTVNVQRVEQLATNLLNLDLDGQRPDDQIIVLVNDGVYGGSGNPFFDITVAYTGKLGSQVMIHEFGHSFGNLGDEYVAYNEDCPASLAIPYANIDWDGSKWENVSGTGSFKGAWFANLVRPTYDSCVMRRISFYGGFCPVCAKALEILLGDYERFLWDIDDALIFLVLGTVSFALIMFVDRILFRR